MSILRGNINRIQTGFVICLAILLQFEVSFSQSVLPAGVWHPRLIFGTVSEVSSKFNEEGSLNSIGRYNQTVDSNFLKTIVPDFQEKAEILNDISPSLAIGDQLNLGTLEFTGGPELTYFAPVLAYGVTSKWTLGIGFPIISLQGGVEVSQTGRNNASAVRQMLAGEGVQVQNEMIEALDDLSKIDLVSELRTTLRERGYKDLEEKNEQTIGDVQLLSFYEYYSNWMWDLYLSTIINLPTGPVDDPDDLQDIPNMHQTGIQLKSHHDMKFSDSFLIGTAVGYYWKAPDTIVKRVPENEDDLLPKENRKENLNRDIGDTVLLDVYSKVSLAPFLDLKGGVSWARKERDEYMGHREGYDYSLLERYTASEWMQGKLGITFTTVKMFREGSSKIPFLVGYEYSDIISGTNVVRQRRHELSLMTFF